MDYLHQCVMCDWQRRGASPTVTSPRCENCGCALESVHESDLPTAEGLGQGIAVPEGLRKAFGRASAVAGTGVLMLAAALTGYTEGGLSISVSAVGVAGLLVVNVMAAERV